MMGWLWHQLDHMQIICTSLQTDNHASKVRKSIRPVRTVIRCSQHLIAVFTGRMLFLTPKQQCQSTVVIMMCQLLLI